MNIFISWSGSNSQRIAEEIKIYLEETLQATNPWISTAINKGQRWSPEIARRLENSNFGIICLTKENLQSPWILFEAGALSKIADRSLFTLLLGLEFNDIQQPLAQFQHTKFEKEDFRKLLHSINESLLDLGIRNLKSERLNNIFNRTWPNLETKINSILSEEISDPIERTTESKINELLDLARSLNSNNTNSYKLEPGKHYTVNHKGQLYETLGPGQAVSFNRISQIQKALSEKGYECRIDNVMGQDTKDTLIRFQKDNNLPVGALDFKTLDALGISH